MKLTNVTAIAAISLATLMGCQNKDQNGFFKGEEAAGERVKKFAQVQASNGARNDAMLYPHHFNGGHLNSLGRQKVLLMLEDCDNCEPVVVHLVNAGAEELLAQRKAAVELYLKTAEGPNKLAFHPAQADLIRFNKTESGKVDSASSEASAGDTGSGTANMDPSTPK